MILLSVIARRKRSFSLPWTTFRTSHRSLNTHQSRTEYNKVAKITDSERLCRWGIQHWQDLLFQSEIILELLNHGIALTGGFFEFPAVHNLHCTPHVLYDPLFLQY